MEDKKTCNTLRKFSSNPSAVALYKAADSSFRIIELGEFEPVDSKNLLELYVRNDYSSDNNDYALLVYDKGTEDHIKCSKNLDYTVENLINGGKLFIPNEDEDDYMLYGVIGAHHPEYDYLAAYNRKFIIRHSNYNRFDVEYFLSNRTNYLADNISGYGLYELFINEDNKIYEFLGAAFLGNDKSKTTGYFN